MTSCRYVDARCLWECMFLLLRTVQLCVLIDALGSLLGCFWVLTKAAPQLAPCPAGANVEDVFVRYSSAGFNLNTALLTALENWSGA